jgi:hypothetical protein
MAWEAGGIAYEDAAGASRRWGSGMLAGTMVIAVRGGV